MIEQELFEMQDLDYKEFHKKLIPTVDPDRIIGIRTPRLRKFAKEFVKRSEDEKKAFLAELPHQYYEENNLHGFMLETIRDYDELIQELDRFLPYVDNWATCDMINPKALKKYPAQLYTKIKEWLNSGKTYTIRFGIGMLMRYYLDENFKTEYPDQAAAVQSEEYYVNMMRAWYFATALAKQYEHIIPYIEERRLDLWTHNKSIQKGLESNRISETQKKYLRSLKI